MQLNFAIVYVELCVIGWQGNPDPMTSLYSNLHVFAVTFTNAGKLNKSTWVVRFNYF